MISSWWPGIVLLVTGVFWAGAIVWQVKNLTTKVDTIIENHLPHILAGISDVRERLARIEGPRG